MSNPYPTLPKDKSSETMQEYPAAKKALARYTDTNAAASSVISVTNGTTAIEVAAVTVPAFIRWVVTTETAAVAPFASVIAIPGTTSNYDHVVPAGTVRRFAIPIESQGSSSIQGANRAAGLYQRIAAISGGIGSVMLTEY